MKNWIRKQLAAARRRRLEAELRELAVLGDCAQSRFAAVVRELAGVAR